MKNYLLNEGYSVDKKLFVKAKKCYIKDNKGKKYIDTSLGSGTHILGHNHPVIVNALSKQIKKGTVFTVNNPLAHEVAKQIIHCVPSLENIVFCNSGSEATMRAARIARAYTNKKKIAIFSGGWHGGNELFLYDFDYSKDDLQTYHKSSGIPDEFKDLVIVLPYNDQKAFDIIRQHKNELAMVMIEPAQGSNPRDDMKEFLSNLRDITSLNNIVLCFDEMITGFRVSLGGAQEYYNIEADLVTYGKTIGGGLPIGVVGGKKKFMDTIKKNKNNLPTFMGGTFSANPLTMSSAKALLKYLIKNKQKIYTKLNKYAKDIKEHINKYCIKNNIAIRIIGLNSMMRIVFTDYPIKSRVDRDKYEISIKKQDKFFNYLLKENKIFVNNNRIIFLSLTHNQKLINYMKDSLISAIDLYFNKRL